MSAQAPIPTNVWLQHGHSRNTLTAVHAAHVDTLDPTGELGHANRYLLERDLAAGIVAVQGGSP